MTSSYESFPDLSIDRPADGVLRITLDGPGLNAVGPEVHRELADVWLAVDRDPDDPRRAPPGSRQGFSAGGSFELLDVHDGGLRGPDPGRCARPATSSSTSSTAPSRSSRPSTARRSAPASSPACSPTCRSSPARPASSTATPRLGVAAGDHAAICWPLLCGMAKAKYYLLTCETLTGEEAERIGLVSLCVDDDARCRTGRSRWPRSWPPAPSRAIRWTKQTLNHWYRPQSADPRRVVWPTSSTASAAPTPPRAWPPSREARAPRFGGPTSE